MNGKIEPRGVRFSNVTTYIIFQGCQLYPSISGKVDIHDGMQLLHLSHICSIKNAEQFLKTLLKSSELYTTELK